MRVAVIGLGAVGTRAARQLASTDAVEEIVLRDAARGVYRRLVLKDNRIIGVVMYGDTSDGAWFFDLLKRGTDVREMRETLIFGQGYAGGIPLDPTAAVAALPDDAEVCGCNGVCKGTIVQAIKSPDIQQAFAKQAAEPVGSSPEEFAAFIRKETDKGGKTIRAAGISAE